MGGGRVSIALLVVAWIVYDVLCRLLLPRGRNGEIVLWILLVLLTTLAAWGCGELFQPRAAFLQVGAMLGTIMAANVFFNIIPAHWELINAKKAGRGARSDPGDHRPEALGPQQLLHAPVLFKLLAGHFAFVYGAGAAWLVLIAIMLLGVLTRVFYNLRHQGRTIWALPVLGVVGVLLLVWALEAGARQWRRGADGCLLGRGARDRAAVRTVPRTGSDGARVLQPACRDHPRDP